MKQFKKVVASNGKYKDSQGQEKNRYITVGRAFIREDKSVCIKLDSMPVGPEFSGWLNLYDLDEDRQQKPVAQSAPALDPKEDLPF
jgi:hypothetical protein